MGIAIPSEYSLHKKVHNSAKLLSQCRNFPVGHRLRHCMPAYHVVRWNLECLFAGRRVWRPSGVLCRAVPVVLLCLVQLWRGRWISRLLNLRTITSPLETKWFGSDIWPIGEWTFLHSGHPLLADNEGVARRNGVGILLDAAGEVWKSVPPRIVSARLKLASAGQRLCGGLHHSHDVFVFVICVYTSTVCVPGEMVKSFYDDLQDILNGSPPNDLLLMLEYLNAHVGVWGKSSEMWSDVLGCFGIDDRN